MIAKIVHRLEMKCHSIIALLVPEQENNSCFWVVYREMPHTSMALDLAQSP